MSKSRIHSTQRWRKLALRTVREEPTCHLQLPGCTYLSTCADHIIPVSLRPDLAFERANTAGACKPCNYRRGNTPWNQLDELRVALAETQPDVAQRGRSFFDAKPSKLSDSIVTLGA